MIIINPGKEDFHSHSFTFSDGFNGIDELVRAAGEMRIKTLAITDHSQAYLDAYGYAKKCNRWGLDRWRNVYNDVKIIFGVEADILNAQGRVSMDIQGRIQDFVILAAHKNTFQDDKRTITEAYLNAMRLHAGKIKFLAHPCAVYFQEYLDIEKVTEAANEFGIPMEFNCAYYINGMTDMDNLRIMLSKVEQVTVNSDAHTLYELQNARNIGLNYLRKAGYLEE